jgi:hypothetical protein
MKNCAWWWTRLLPLFLWITMILWIASRPKTSLFPTEVKTLLGIPREWFQYPYHFSAFFILAFLFRRSFSGSINHLGEYKFAVFSLLGCALVSFCSEGLQFYVPTRTPALRDLALDQSGAVLAMIIALRHFSDKVGRIWQ